MAEKDILSHYGPDYHAPQRPRATSGGVKTAKDVMRYSPPQGPTNIHDHGPGLHGDNHGNAFCPVAGKGEGGHAGIGGTRLPHGTQED
jgi:hypothetical protein